MSTESYTVCNIPNGTITRLEISDATARAIVAEYGGAGWRVCQMGRVIVLHTAPKTCDCGGTGAIRYAGNREIDCPKCEATSKASNQRQKNAMNLYEILERAVIRAYGKGGK